MKWIFGLAFLILISGCSENGTNENEDEVVVDVGNYSQEDDDEESIVVEEAIDAKTEENEEKKETEKTENTEEQEIVEEEIEEPEEEEGNSPFSEVISSDRKAEIASLKEKELYNHPYFESLGWSKMMVFEKYGEPLEIVEGFMEDIFHYDSLDIVFEKEEEIVKGFIIHSKERNILGTRVGMNFDEVRKVLGEENSEEHSFIDEGVSLVYFIGSYPKDKTVNEIIMEKLSEIRLTFSSPEKGEPVERIIVSWDLILSY